MVMSHQNDSQQRLLRHMELYSTNTPQLWRDPVQWTPNPTIVATLSLLPRFATFALFCPSYRRSGVLHDRENPVIVTSRRLTR